MPARDQVRVVQNPKLALELVEGRGRGVLALEDIRAGEVLEHCPAIPLEEEEGERIDGTVLEPHVIPFDGLYAVVGGYAMFYNHDDEPNADYQETWWGAQESPLVTFRALRDIRAGEPITIDYGAGSPVVWREDGSFEVED